MIATMIIKDATVITMEGAGPRGDAQAIAIDGDRILAVGTNAEVDPLIGPGTRVLSLPGRGVLPGFIDTHVHFTQTGLGVLGPSVYDIRSTEEVLAVLADAVTRADKNQLLFIRGCRLGELDQPITREMLDRVAPHNEVFIDDAGGHSCVINTRAWQSLGMPADTTGAKLNPETGTLAGLLVGKANTLARSVFSSKIDDPTRIAAQQRAAEMAVRVGITTVHALEGGSIIGSERDVEVLLERQNDLPVRTVVYFQSTDVQMVLGFGLPRVGGCILVDGAYGERTAALLEPYADDPTCRGVLYFTDDELNEFVGRAHRAGLQISMHAIGDAAIEQLLNAYERALRDAPRSDHRHRIEHYSLPTSEHIERAARLGVAVAMQPIFAAMPEPPNLDWELAGPEFLGLERFKRRHPYRKIVDAGILVAGGSDSDAKPMDTMAGIHAVVNHPDDDRRLNVFEALSLFTVNAAGIGFEEKEKGTIKPGKLADLVVLKDNPLTVGRRSLKDIPIDITIVGGKVVYDARSDQTK